MGDIHGIAARKLEILTEKPVTQPILRATFAQHGYALQKSPRFWRKTGGWVRYTSSYIFRQLAGQHTSPAAQSVATCHSGVQAIAHRGYGYSIWWIHAK